MSAKLYWGQSKEDDETLNLPKPPSFSSPPKETPASNLKEEDEPSDEPRMQTVPDEAQLPIARRHHRDHPLDQVLGDVSSGVRTRRQVQNEVTNPRPWTGDFQLARPVGE